MRAGLVATLATTLVSAGCVSGQVGTGGVGGTSGSTAGTGGTTSGRPDHPVFAQVPNNGGPTLAAPAVVALTFDDDANQALEHAYLAWAVSSSWLITVGADYGVGNGRYVGDPGLGRNAPSALSDSDVHAALERLFADGGVDVPAAGSSTVFFVFVPATVAYDFFGTPACSAGSVDSYHLWYWHQSTQIPYAVVIDCPPEFNRTDAEQLELDTSHELIEAATDPFGFGDGLDGLPSDGWRITDAGNPFFAVGDEVADLCVLVSDVYTDADAGFVAQRSWSNTAAAAGNGSPCVPAPPDPFYTLATDAGVAFVAPGSTLDITLAGWTSDAGADAGPSWCVIATYPPLADFNPTIGVVDGGATVFQSGTSIVATLGMPTGLPQKAADDAGVIPISYGPVLFESQDCDAGTVVSVWPVQIALPPVGTACGPATPDACAAYGLSCLDGGCG